jgi:hypothetical protein
VIILLLAGIASLKTLPGALRPHLTSVLPALEATTEKKPVERNQWPKLAVLAGDFCAIILGPTRARYAGALMTFLVVHRHLLRHAT